jgi:hypothetical protein
VRKSLRTHSRSGIKQLILSTSVSVSDAVPKLIINNVMFTSSSISRNYVRSILIIYTQSQFLSMQPPAEAMLEYLHPSPG